MRKYVFSAALAASALFCACEKEGARIENEGMVPFSVAISSEQPSDPGTKAWLTGSDQTIKWAADDEFSVYDGVSTADGGLKFTLADGGSSTNCHLTGQISAAAEGPIYFLYPYQTYAASRGKNTTYRTNMSDGIIFPVESSFSYASKPCYLPKKSLMLVGKMPSKDSADPVVMKTPMGFVKFKLVNDGVHDITKIELTCQLSHFIAGTVAIDCSGEDPAIIMQGKGTGVYAGDPTLSTSQQKVALDIVITPSGTDYFPDGTYYFALPPQTYDGGVRLKFTDDMNCTAVKSGSSDLVINRAKVRSLGTVNAEDLGWYESIDLRFLNAVTETNWPFNEAKPSKIAKASTVTFTYGEDGDVFKFYNQCTSDGGLWSTSGLNIKGKLSYVEIPGRTGKKIHSIIVRVGGQGGNCGNPVLADATGADTEGKYNILQSDSTFARLVPGNDEDNAKMNGWWGNKKYGYQKQYSDFDTEGEKNYRILCTASSDWLKIINLTVQYEDLQ